MNVSCNVAEYLFTASSAVFLTLSAFGGWQAFSLLTVLRFRHPITWNQLGRPDGTGNGDDVGKAAVLIRFRWRRDFLNLGDSQFSSMCERSRRGMLLSLVVFAITFALLAATPSVERALLFQCWRSA